MEQLEIQREVLLESPRIQILERASKSQTTIERPHITGQEDAQGPNRMTKQNDETSMGSTMSENAGSETGWLSSCQSTRCNIPIRLLSFEITSSTSAQSSTEACPATPCGTMKETEAPSGP